MIGTRFAQVSLLALGFGAIGTGAAVAAEVAAATEVADDATTIGEVIVTAQKREERLLDVPISVTSANKEKLEAAGIASTRDLAQLSPGLVTVNNGLAFQPAIRGITSTSTAVGDDSNVATYIDDVYIGNNVAAMFALKDVARIEILKGPQGTLFGRNATGGAIRVVTRDPTQDFQVEASASYIPTFEERSVSGFVAGGISENLAASLAASYTKNDGLGYNINPARFGERIGVTDQHAIRGKLLFTPTDDVRLVFSIDNVKSNNNSAYLLTIENNNNVFNSTNTPGVIPNPGKPFTTNLSAKPTISYEGTGASMNAGFDFGDYSLKSITSYRFTRQLSAGDLDRTNLSISSFQSPAKQKAFTQEINLSFDNEGPYSWIGGFYYFNQSSDARSKTFAGDYAPLTSVAHGTIEDAAYALFGEFTVRPVENLFLTAGVRYNSEEKVWAYNDEVRAAGLRSGTDTDSWDNVTYRLTGRFEFRPDSNVYASYSTGFKSGTYNTVTFPLNKVDPEKINAVEVGLKSRINRDLFVTFAAYHYDYKNIQIQAFDSSPTALRIVLLNAATAKITGLDATLDARLNQYFDASLGVSYIPQAEYENFPAGFMTIPKPGGGNNSVAPIDLSGTRMIRTPKQTVNLALNYRAPFQDGKLSATVNALYNSGYVWWPGERLKQGSYTLINAKASWEAPGGRWKLSVFGENLADELNGVYEGTSNTGDALSYNRPRNWGVSIDFKY